MKMGYTLDTLEQMLPWEREIYVTMIVKDLIEENEKRKQELQGRKPL